MTPVTRDKKVSLRSRNTIKDTVIRRVAGDAVGDRGWVDQRGNPSKFLHNRVDPLFTPPKPPHHDAGKLAEYLYGQAQVKVASSRELDNIIWVAKSEAR